GTDRRRGGTPFGAILRIPQQEHLARWVAYYVVRPSRDLVLLAVDGPRITAARRRHQESEIRIGDEMRPRRGRARAIAQHGDIFASILGEPTEAIPEVQLLRRWHGGRLPATNLRRGPRRHVDKRC